jgi:hypothetical protein
LTPRRRAAVQIVDENYFFTLVKLKPKKVGLNR